MLESVEVSESVVASRFEILDEFLGEGAYGTVFVARDRETGVRVAAKRLNNHDDQGIEMTPAQVEREVNAYRHLERSTVARCKYMLAFLGDELLERARFVFLELCEHGELFDYSVDRGGLSERDARPLFKQMLAAVGYLHASGLAHRDIKLENFFVNRTGEVRLGDLGLAHSNPEGGEVQCSDFKGTDGYAAPEVWFQSQGTPGAFRARTEHFAAFPGENSEGEYKCTARMLLSFLPSPDPMRSALPN